MFAEKGSHSLGRGWRPKREPLVCIAYPDFLQRLYRVRLYSWGFPVPQPFFLLLGLGLWPSRRSLSNSFLVSFLSKLILSTILHGLPFQGTVDIAFWSGRIIADTRLKPPLLSRRIAVPWLREFVRAVERLRKSGWVFVNSLLFWRGWSLTVQTEHKLFPFLQSVESFSEASSLYYIRPIRIVLSIFWNWVHGVVFICIYMHFWTWKRIPHILSSDWVNVESGNLSLRDFKHVCASFQVFSTIFRCLEPRFCGMKGWNSIFFRYPSEIPSGILSASNLRLNNDH